MIVTDKVFYDKNFSHMKTCFTSMGKLIIKNVINMGGGGNSHSTFMGLCVVLKQ